MSIELHILQAAPRKRHRRRGRGGSRGTYSGRGIKGQRARTGGKSKGKFSGKKVPTFLLKLPKTRGFKTRREKPEIVNIADIERLFKAGETVTIRLMRAKGLVRSGKNVKILGKGNITKKLTIEAHRFSKSAQQKIIQGGGKATLITTNP